ncbi:MAG: hypothetical protein QM496_13975 [Verrucomicrobiota bacterium]
MKDYGLDKGRRLAAEREAARNEEKQKVRLEPGFPYEVIPPSFDFMDFSTNPQKVEK